MQKTIAIIACGVAMLCSANAAIDLRVWSTEGGDLLSVSEWNYMWNLEDVTGATRDDQTGNQNAYNAYVAVESTDRGLVAELTTADSTAYNLDLGISNCNFSLDQAIYVNAIKNSLNDGSTITMNLGSNGSIHATGDDSPGINLGSEHPSLAITLSGTSSRDLITSKQDVWNLTDNLGSAKLTIQNNDSGLVVLQGCASSADAIQEGQIGLVYANNTLSVVSKQAPATPEPTTATLSLLALAGLAARRRRK